MLHIHHGMGNVRRVLRGIELHLLIARPNAPRMEMKPSPRLSAGKFFYEAARIRNCPRRRIKNMHFNRERSRQLAFKADVLARTETITSQTISYLPPRQHISAVVCSQELQRTIVAGGDQADTAKAHVIADYLILLFSGFVVLQLFASIVCAIDYQMFN